MPFIKRVSDENFGVFGVRKARQLARQAKARRSVPKRK